MHSDSTLFEIDYTDDLFLRDAKALKISRPKHAIDEAREFSGWTIDKLELLALYFKQYRRVAGGGTYIDGFAGTGRISVNAETRDGSASIAIGAGAFKNLYFFERPRNAARLQRHLQRAFRPAQQAKCSVAPGDFNIEVRKLLTEERIPRDKACFAFLDPNSTELEWTTVEALSQYKGDGLGGLKVELWILFNTHQALIRLMPRKPGPSYPSSASAKTLDKVMGGRDAWWDVFEGIRSPYALAKRYSDRLVTTLGYRASRMHLILDRETQRAQYYMVHASDHPAAFSFMRWAEVQTSQERYETIPMFDLPNAVEASALPSDSP